MPRSFPKVAVGDVDLFVAAWLPYAHADYWKEYGDRLVKVSTLYEDAQLYWAVPDYVPAEAVRSVADLTRPEVAARMTKTIRGTLPDSGLMIGSRKIFEHYRLSEAGYELVPGPAPEWLANFNARVAAKDWFVMPLWRPQFLNKAHRLRVLDEPQQFLGAEQGHARGQRRVLRATEQAAAPAAFPDRGLREGRDRAGLLGECRQDESARRRKTLDRDESQHGHLLDRGSGRVMAHGGTP
ncbi:MAG: glycine/betaine ABC transporter substrate-binding protein [Betaproteobacteria bacterium]|nr:glycine/betaine ABC transporter substrate-binding protein [Betaproteobacteria bacterium]